MPGKLETILDDGGLMIVESPTKAREITKFLPSNHKWKVVATLGFMFELKDPKHLTDKEREQGQDYSVRLDDGSFERFLERDPQNSKNLTSLKADVQSGRWKHFYVSTDPDEAGELIGREVVEYLENDLKRAGMDVRRASWHEITRKAVEAGLQAWGKIDENKADSAEARQVYDRLFGFSASHWMWRVKGGKSGGRAQSPCLRLIVDREKERLAFVKASYASVTAMFDVNGESMEFTLVKWNKTRIAVGSDFDAHGDLKNSDKLVITDDLAKKIKTELASKQFKVIKIAEKPYTRRPAPPFTTSTYQQSVGSKLGLSSKRLMSIAQYGFEHSDLTYLRTDSPYMATEAVSAVRKIIARDYGGAMPARPIMYKPKSKNAQEGHECIRPVVDEKTGLFLPSALILAKHRNDQRMDVDYPRVYDLIYKRAIASQMNAATGVTRTITVASTDGVAEFSAVNTRIDYKGFLEVYDD